MIGTNLREGDADDGLLYMKLQKQEEVERSRERECLEA
jgi:hypothetical protein